ncbi:hypothetical protein SS1G_06823 [Sclerotinia sclerotiorum 1980 UF-70]|uniref:Secondary alcohol dehydrogenase protein n=2 Tax=Sclerotinia sclerotiorum (strain ATCC 18683 / 1980 / Ss-1) TaxID=665079 RepID=A7ENC4_SCLS1|nr:hypothetical protein SS1G_06823 [Sclerotinia sclerotiorum 1980 UF-70]APA14800.1 hypothetical protein sscle_13g095700 [Sclerotinia sclerotiorum 1980 UF-70]EDO04340.1 hypothetical protein SS1G_06823 [Sclerotinia sclerotiorum 1980 UF-70]
MSADALPISPGAFAEALKDLPMSTLHLKAAELRNSIAHLDYSNEQLKPFAEGRAPECVDGKVDEDCVDAIRENEVVITRMETRISLLRTEIESRGGVWGEYEAGAESKPEADIATPAPATNGTAPAGEESRSNPWADGTFTTGRIVGGEVVMDPTPAAATAPTNGQSRSNGVSSTNGTTTTTTNTGGTLDDETLRRAMELRMRADAGADEDDEGMHL